jgi:hypothetical protein
MSNRDHSFTWGDVLLFAVAVAIVIVLEQL